jgi:hypothetical protein
VLVAACGSPGPDRQATGTTATSPPSLSTATSAPAGGPTATPGGSPARSPGAPASGAASTRPGISPSASVDPLATPGAAASCTGTAANQDFFAASATASTFDVYCAVLPKGWFVDTGSRKGGLLQIAYKTTSGLRLELKEGAVCSGTPATCGPMDAVIGTAMFGDREGQLGRLGTNLVLYVSPGANPSWQATGIGLDEATFRAFGAALVKVPR